MPTFFINRTKLELANFINIRETLNIRSSPRPYTVEFQFGDGVGDRLSKNILKNSSPLLLADKWIFENYLKQHANLNSIPRLLIDATEENKNINTVLNIIDFLQIHSASKKSMLYAIGGGIIQDLGAFSSYMYKRGIPWTYVPTTLLAQSDSSVGGKTALNHRSTKNLLALFSAPRHIITETGFLSTLPHDDWLSGGGEILRLCITGGEDSLRELEQSISHFVTRDLEVTTKLIQVSLSVKKAVVEFDEFELDARRAMNYGHSFGHALEAITDYQIPHGVGVTLGILVENQISHLRGLLSKVQRDRIIRVANNLISNEIWEIFRNTNLNGILEFLKSDKKVEGHLLKLATLREIGHIEFIDLPLNSEGDIEVKNAFEQVVLDLSTIRHA
jgi:3-dehydroquinate synthase